MSTSVDSSHWWVSYHRYHYSVSTVNQLNLAMPIHMVVDIEDQRWHQIWLTILDHDHHHHHHHRHHDHEWKTRQKQQMELEFYFTTHQIRSNRIEEDVECVVLYPAWLSSSASWSCSCFRSSSRLASSAFRASSRTFLSASRLTSASMTCFNIRWVKATRGWWHSMDKLPTRLIFRYWLRNYWQPSSMRCRLSASIPVPLPDWPQWIFLPLEVQQGESLTRASRDQDLINDEHYEYDNDHFDQHHLLTMKPEVWMISRIYRRIHWSNMNNMN